MARLAFPSQGLDRLKLSAGQPNHQPPSVTDCNFVHLLASSPAATKAYQEWERALAGGQLTVRQRELLALAVAEINGCKYCLSAHYALGRKAGLSDEDIRLARQAAGVTPQEEAMLRFARAVTLQRGEISDADFQSVRRAGFNDAQITEIIAGIALNIFTNYFNSMARTEVDFPVLKPGLESPVVRTSATDLRNR